MTSAAEAEKFAYLQWQRQADPPYYINSTAISADGGRVVAGTFFHAYAPQMPAVPAAPALPNQFGTYCFNRDGDQLWVDQFQGYEGVYTVAISGQGNIAASGGWFSSSPFEGFIRAYDVESGPANILNYNPPERVNALALSSDGSVLVAASDQIYMFTQTDGVFSDQPAILPLHASPTDSTQTNNAQTIAITSDGAWILVGDLFGNVYLVENNAGSFGTPYIWNNSALSTIHSVAMTPDGDWFAVGGGGTTSTVYLFSQTSMQANPPAPAGTYTMDTGSRVGWVAITDDGGMISAVGNKGTAGSVVAIDNDDGTLTKRWESPTPHNPNSTSMDASGAMVAVADGYPDQKPGSFSLFLGETGALVWQYATPNMNWPMFVSADGSGIVAGTDDGIIFYFTPEEIEFVDEAGGCEEDS